MSDSHCSPRRRALNAGFLLTSPRDSEKGSVIIAAVR
jgi:hypothetical protein